jgi:hypothetical protein
MHGERRFSQAIADGDGISLVAAATDLAAAERAEAAGARAIVATSAFGEHALPVLWRGAGGPQAARDAEADAWVLVAANAGDDDDRLVDRYNEVLDMGLDCVVQVDDADELERVLESLDPEVFLLTPGEGEDPLEHVLELLEDVPAGKLAVADVTPLDAEELEALERAGVDAVIVPLEAVAALAAAP